MGKNLRCMEMALVHDMAESIVGDITPLDNIPKEEKHAKEMNAMQYISTLVPEYTATQIMALFEEYEAGVTREAVAVKDIDKYELLVQTLEYEKTSGQVLTGFWDVADRVKLELFKKWTADVLEQRRIVWLDRGVTV